MTRTPNLTTHMVARRESLTKKQPRILFVVSVDWFFFFHRLPVARAALKAGFDV